MTTLFDVFISYGRADSKEFAIKLQARLHEQGFRVWFDFNDIPLGVDFQNQINDGIEKAHHFLFLISPHSVNSSYCRKEIELAIKFNKRIIPLLHVEEIHRETWLQRHNSKDIDWEACQAKGLHNSYQNMHPTIGKINWVYFREDKDDFEKSLADLINLLRFHTDYVEQHTKFLVKALEWERHKKQTNYLLVGEEKQQAQSWLKIRFQNEQAPCIPADLHCEYITESIKNGNNLMTQVFLSYADEDRTTMEKIRNSLRRESITVWTNTTDIQTGEAFESAIKRGIEQADNVVYLLSPDSINSTYCQMELDYALSLHKRIIPLLVRETDSMQMPSALRELHYIDLSDNLKEEDYQHDESHLLKILHEDTAYYNEHKILLTKALKWKQQHDNPSILLRGYNLRSAEAWLKVAQKRTQYSPTPLQVEFIAESQKQPPLESLDVFISYSRADSDFARKLNDTLQIQGKTTWFDQESIASGSDFQEEINRGIKVSDNFLFILSQRSVSSPYCKDEVEYAASLNKRCVTVLHREVEPSKLHPELAKIQWIDFHGNGQDFNANFNQLVRTLDTDREHVRNHSKWSQRALEWQEKDKSDDLLLRGNEFVIAQNWLQETEQQKKNPAATIVQKEFIAASQNAIELAKAEEERRQTEMLHLQEEKRKEAEARLAEQKKNAKRQKFFLVAISTALVAACFLMVEARIAKKNALQAQKAQFNSVSRFSSLLSQENLKFDALLEAIKVYGKMQKLGNEKVDTKTRSLLLTALQTTVYEDGFREQNRLTKHKGTVFDVAWSPNGETIATASGDGKVILWDSHGKELQTLTPFNGGEVSSVSFSPDGKTIAASSMNEIKLWQFNGQQVETIESFKCCEDKESIYFDKVGFSSDGNTIITLTEGETVDVQYWDKQGKLVKTFSGDEAKTLKDLPKTWRDILSAYGTQITNGKFTAKVIQNNKNDKNDKNDKNALEISDKETKKVVQILKGHKGSIISFQFSPNGETIATASEDNTVKLWGLSGKKLKKLQEQENNQAEIWSVAGSPDGNILAYPGADNTIKLWNKESKVIKILKGHTELIRSVAWSLDGKTIASGSDDNTIKLWSKDGDLLKTLEGNKEFIWSVAWSPDKQTIAFDGENSTIKLWNKESEELKTLTGHKNDILSVAWSPDGNFIASGSRDKTIKLWNKEGNFLQTLEGHTATISSVAWSIDGDTIASASEDNTIKLWRKKGKEFKFFKTLTGHQNNILSVAFSPDRKTIASTSSDMTVKLWNQDGKEIQTLNGHNEAVTSVSFSPDGKTLVSADYSTIILWNLEDLTLDKLIADACAQVKDYLQHNAPEEDKHLCNDINSKK